MKKILPILILLILAIPISGFAITITFKNPLTTPNFTEIINRLIDFIFLVAVVIAPLMIVIAGILFATAGGDPQKIGLAKKVILYTLIAFAIILLAKGIYPFIMDLLGVSPVSQQ